jgi:hypothetical protein
MYELCITHTELIFFIVQTLLVSALPVTSTTADISNNKVKLGYDIHYDFSAWIP